MKIVKKPFACGVLSAFLLVFSISSLSLTSCVESGHPEIKLTFESDYSGIIAAIESAKLSLSEKLSLVEAAVKDQTAGLDSKLALIEAAVKAGFADSNAQQKLLQQAIESLSGTVEEKLSSVETAIQSQTSSFETKLGLIEAAVAAGFADAKSQRELLQQTIEALSGTLEEKLSSVETAIQSQTSSFETKLGLVEAAVKTGFADGNAQQKLLQQAVESLSGTVEEKLSALDTAIQSQTSSFETKLGLVEAAVKTGFADGQAALALLNTSLEALQASSASSDPALLSAIEAVSDELKKIGTTLSTGEIATMLSNIFAAVSGQANYSSMLADILKAIEALKPKEINGHAYVEMGDGLKWATCNVGAAKPEEYGSYFAWGETSPKSDYSWASYVHANGAYNKLTKYCPTDETSYWDVSGDPDGKLVLELEDDAAAMNWGGTWRMPTDAEWTQLRTGAYKWEWQSDYKDANGVSTGVKGWKVTSLVAGYVGNSIFLPAAGFRNSADLLDAGYYGYYWSSSLYTVYPDYAWYVYFDGTGVNGSSDFNRRYGLSVRPVSE